MATEKLYTVAGITNIEGETKVRFGSDLVSRIKIFSGDPKTIVNLIELPQPMTKLEALQHLSKHEKFQEPETSFAIQSKLAEKTKAAKKGEVKIAAGSIKSAVKQTVEA